METTENLRKLKHVLQSKDPVLFTGAGFSLGAKQSDNTPIPNGQELKLRIISEILKYEEGSPEYEELRNENLQNVCEHTNLHHQPVLQDFLTAVFTGCIPDECHKIICSYKWAKIYTTNIDDIVENCIDNKKLLVQNLSRIRTGATSSKIEYIKLHGCVRNQESGYTFSEREYVDSMLKSRDYRFNSFGQDIQYKDFIFIGTDFNEINLDYYLSLYENAPAKTAKGLLFFINPSTRIMFRTRIERIGGIIIDMKTAEFAEYLKNEITESKLDKTKKTINNFKVLNYDLDKLKQFKAYRSNLYVGDTPKWLDIINDWDFNNSEVWDNFQTYYKHIQENGIFHSIYALVGKSLAGKSTYCRRIAYSLCNDGYTVLEFTGKVFDYFSLVLFCKTSNISKLCILVDSASYYYGAFRSLMQSLPESVDLIILANSRPYFHNRKKYNIITENYYEYYVPSYISYSFAKEIERKLYKKGYLGSFKKYEKSARIELIKKTNDIPDCLYSVTFSKKFIDRFMDDLLPRYNHFYYGKELIAYLAIFHELDLNYLPLEIVTLIFQQDTNNALNEIDDFIKYNESNGISIRNGALAKIIINKLKPNQRIEYIKELLINISPQVSEREHTYWNEIEACLLKEKLLRKRLGLRTSAIRNMLFEIQDYYNESYNYWIQVGITEQFSYEFEKALNHFQQAEALYPNSYMVQNAIARNFLRQANYCKEPEKARVLYDEGERRILQLIREREEFQVKAFSTHCYLYEKINFYIKFNIVPTDKELNEMFSMLRKICDKMPEDGMSKHISNKFYEFIVHFKKENVIHMTLSDLSALKHMFNDYDINADSFFEDFELD